MAGTVTMKGLSSDTDWTKLIEDMQNAQKTYATRSLNTRKTQNDEKLSAWQSLNTYLSVITTFISSNNLDKATGYNLYSSELFSNDSSVTPSNVLSVSLGSISGPGNYSIEVTSLAKAEKISSDVFDSKDTALGISGDIIVNNKKVTFEATDNLINVADRINSSGGGVVATVLSISNNEYKLLIESEKTGAGSMYLKNGSSTNVLQSLNLLTSTKQIAHESGLDAFSDTFTDKTSAIGSLLGLTSPESGTIKVRGTDDVLYDVNVDLSTDSLESIATAINTANGGSNIPGVTASVEEMTENGITTYKLKLANIDINDLTDDKNILDTLGVTGSTRKNTVRSGQDATFIIDGNTITSSSNTVTDAISGTILKLVGTNIDKPIELRITQDSSQVVQKVTSLVQNMNNVITNINNQNSSSDGKTNPLFGDINLTSIKNSLHMAIFETVEKNSVYTSASSIGISFQKDGTLSIDNDKLTSAISTNRQETIDVLKSLNDSLYKKMDLYVDPYSGSIKLIQDSITANTTSIKERLDAIDSRFERQKEILEKKFNALELLISTSNMTKNWLTQQVNYMTKQR